MIIRLGATAVFHLAAVFCLAAGDLLFSVECMCVCVCVCLGVCVCVFEVIRIIKTICALYILT